MEKNRKKSSKIKNYPELKKFTKRLNWIKNTGMVGIAKIP